MMHVYGEEKLQLKAWIKGGVLDAVEEICAI